MIIAATVEGEANGREDQYVMSWDRNLSGILFIYEYIVGASRVAQLVENLPAMQETPVQSLGQAYPLEKG